MGEGLVFKEVFFIKLCDKTAVKKQSSLQIFMKVLRNESNKHKLKKEKVCPSHYRDEIDFILRDIAERW